MRKIIEYMIVTEDDDEEFCRRVEMLVDEDEWQPLGPPQMAICSLEDAVITKYIQALVRYEESK